MTKLSREQYRLIRRTERRMFGAVWLICFVFALLFGGLLLFSMYGCSRSEVSPGQTWIYIPNRNNPNPYEPERRYENKVLEVKNDWIKYQSDKYENNKLINSTVRSDVISWFLIDSKLKEVTP